eukprot:4925380-Amphidinium_carterae.1
MAVSVDEKGPLDYAISSVVETLHQWGCKKTVVRIDGEPAITALFNAVKAKRKEETVLELRPRYSSPSL